MPHGLDRETKAIRLTIAHSLQILRSCPTPDTFLGRKTQEPFPAEEDQDARMAGAKELLPPQQSSPREPA
jgi:hypothetical protein